MSDLGQYQNSIPELPTLGNLRYENIFKVYANKDGKYFYNVLTTVMFPNETDENLFNTITLSKSVPWPIISYNAYKTIDLWWLIALTNGVKNPFTFPTDGKIRILKPNYVGDVISQISRSLL